MTNLICRKCHQQLTDTDGVAVVPFTWTQHGPYCASCCVTPLDPPDSGTSAASSGMQPVRKVTFRYNGQEFTYMDRTPFGGDPNRWMTVALMCTLLAMENPQVEAVLNAFGIQLHDDHNRQIFPRVPAGQQKAKIQEDE